MCSPPDLSAWLTNHLATQPIVIEILYYTAEMLSLSWSYYDNAMHIQNEIKQISRCKTLKKVFVDLAMTYFLTIACPTAFIVIGLYMYVHNFYLL